MTELQEKLDEASVLLKEAKDENLALKNESIQPSSSLPNDPTQVEVCTILVMSY